MASLVVTPAHVAIPGRPRDNTMMAQYRVAMGIAGTKWVPNLVLAGLGLLFQVAGCPRCPSAYARAIAALGAARNDSWGPPHVASLATRQLQEALA